MSNTPATTDTRTETTATQEPTKEQQKAFIKKGLTPFGNKRPRTSLPGGNVFGTIAAARRALQRAGLYAEANRLAADVSENAGSYDGALAIIMHYIDIEV